MSAGGASGGKIDAFIDTFGSGYVKMAIDLGASRSFPFAEGWAP
jgi:hypothetical protein